MNVGARTDRLEGKIAIVAGGAGPGIGHGISTVLAGKGAQVVIVEIDLEAANRMTIVAGRILYDPSGLTCPRRERLSSILFWSGSEPPPRKQHADAGVPAGGAVGVPVGKLDRLVNYLDSFRAWLARSVWNSFHSESACGLSPMRWYTWPMR